MLYCQLIQPAMSSLYLITCSWFLVLNNLLAIYKSNCSTHLFILHRIHTKAIMIPTRISPPIETPITTGISSCCDEGDVAVPLTGEGVKLLDVESPT